MKAIKLDSFSRVSKENATEASPAGTIKFHYAVSGTKEELAEYKEARGEYYREVSEGTSKGLPLWRTSQILPDEVNITLNKDGFVQVVESLEEAVEKSLAQKLEKRLAKGNRLAEIEAAAQMCAKYGVAMKA